MTTPVRAFRCIKSGASWWTAGKLYPVVNGEVEDDDAGKPNRGIYTWAASEMNDFIDADFQEVWVWPDGTELEVIE